MSTAFEVNPNFAPATKYNVAMKNENVKSRKIPLPLVFSILDIPELLI